MLDVFYSDHADFPLPERHHFPQQKYRLLRERLGPLVAAGQVTLHAAEPVERDDLLRVHTAEYIDRVMQGDLPPRQQRELGFPWSPEYAQRTRHSCGATVQAAARAIQTGAAAHTAGGTHHAFAERPAGFCVFNDAVVAIRRLQADGLVERVLIFDCDVHHGDGTAALTADDESIYTVSLHGARNYPKVKPPSDLDVPLPDGVEDEEYLAALDEALEAASPHQGDCVFYLAGSDPFVGDKYGRMALTKDGLAERDRMVFAACRGTGIPIVAMMAGGYARDMNDTVGIHYRTIELMAEFAAD